ncbi:MAG: YeeE/YedE family protein [Gammaproteobacteria bacterium]
MSGFTPVASALGGILIGLSVAALFFLNGKILGISNITVELFNTKSQHKTWRVLFMAGLLAGGAILLALYPQALNRESPRTLGFLIVGGLLVGFGSSLGGGCTSGHGVCGTSRLSLRSITATGVFMATGILTVYIINLVS